MKGCPLTTVLRALAVLLALVLTVRGQGNSEPSPAADALYATPEMYGAIGDDDGDDTVALQQLFSERHGKVIFIPAREYLVSDTIVIPPIGGIRVQGVASSVGRRMPPKVRGHVSSLVWIGGPDKPIIEYRGSGLVWDSVALFGRRSEADEVRAAIGFLVHKVGKGVGTGKALFRQINIFDCDTGFQVGLSEGEHNCDNLIFNWFNVGDCDVGYRVKNNMGMDHSFQFARSYGCKTFFYFERGGSIYVHAAGIHHPANKELLRLGWAGKNNAQYYFSNIKFDAQLTDFKFVTMEQPIPAFITMDNLKRSFHYERDEETGGMRIHSRYALEKLFHLKGNAKLIIRNSNGLLTPGSFYGESGLPENDENEKVATPLILIENSLLNAEAADLLHPDSNQNTRLRVRNCFDYYGRWVDYER